MVENEYRIARVEKSLRWFEQDVALLDLRIKELSPERQQSARSFAAAVIEQTRAELDKLVMQRREEVRQSGELPCEPAD